VHWTKEDDWNKCESCRNWLNESIYLACLLNSKEICKK
jgi:hypothetical protein